MKKLDLEISTLSVEIKVLTLNGKRFTKSVFNQIPERQIWDDGGKPVETDIVFIGYVVPDADKTKWFLWKSGGVLYKSANKVTSKYDGYGPTVYTSGLIGDHRLHSRASSWASAKFTDSDQIFIAI